jgi:ABC-type lipoprotein release transport system permease subunit
MNVKQKMGIILLALTLAPVYAVAQDDEKEFKATVVTKSEKEIKVKTKDEEKTVLIGSKTKGVENAKEGSKVTIKYTEKEGKVRATEINPR